MGEPFRCVHGAGVEDPACVECAKIYVPDATMFAVRFGPGSQMRLRCGKCNREHDCDGVIRHGGPRITSVARCVCGDEHACEAS